MSHAEPDDVAGTVRIRTPGGKFRLPDRYDVADAFVYRDPSKTATCGSR